MGGNSGQLKTLVNNNFKKKSALQKPLFTGRDCKLIFVNHLIKSHQEKMCWNKTFLKSLNVHRTGFNIFNNGQLPTLKKS